MTIKTTWEKETLEERFKKSFLGIYNWCLDEGGDDHSEDVLAFIRSELALQKQADCREFEKVIGGNQPETFIETCENCDEEGYGRAWFGHGEPTHEPFGDRYNPTGSVVFCKKCFDQFGIGKEWMGEEIWKRTSELEEHKQIRINSITKVSKENKAQNQLRTQQRIALDSMRGKI